MCISSGRCSTTLHRNLKLAALGPCLHTARAYSSAHRIRAWPRMCVGWKTSFSDGNSFGLLECFARAAGFRGFQRGSRSVCIKRFRFRPSGMWPIDAAQQSKGTSRSAGSSEPHATRNAYHLRHSAATRRFMDAPTDETTAGSPPRGHEVDQDIMEPFHYINQVPGKDVRGKLIDAFQIWLDIPAERIDAIKEVVGMLHNASLLVDDIEDNSKLRRGVPVAHSIYGVASTINTANYVYFQALERTHALGNSRALETFVHEQLNLHRGQGRDIFWRDSNRCPTEEEYESMVLDKTGGLFRLAVGLMQAFSQDQRNYTPLLDQMALYFQIRDDLINLSSPEYMKGKSFCEDLTEGKFSFPIIHCVRAKPNDHRLLNILKQRTEDVDVKKHAVEWMKQAGSFVYTRHRLVSLKGSIAEGIQLLGGHLGLSRLIEGLDRQLEGLDLAEPSSSGDPASSSIGGSGSSPGFLDSL